jgi:hypothetical protein
MTHIDPPYRLLLGSDVERDGVFVELDREEGGRRAILLEVFCSDVDGSLTFTAYEPCEVPFAVVEQFVARARAELADSAATNEES